jgi:HEAT repeat protein
VFWLGQAAAVEVTRELGSLVADDDEEMEVREHAIFALSQRPREEAVPALIRVFRTSDEPRLKKRALFWLADTGDERAIALIEEILTRG